MGNLLYDIPFIPFVLLMIAMLVASVINLKKLKQDEPQKRPWCSMMYVTMLGVPVLTVARCLHDFSKTSKYSDIAGTILLVYLFVFFIVPWSQIFMFTKNGGILKKIIHYFILSFFRNRRICSFCNIIINLFFRYLENYAIK